MKYSPATRIKSLTLAAACFAAQMRVRRGRASIRKDVGCRVSGSGHSRSTRKIKTSCLSVHTRRACTLFHEHQTRFRRRNKLTLFFDTDLRAVALTCAPAAVYSAALPGKIGGGCLSDQAG